MHSTRMALGSRPPPASRWRLLSMLAAILSLALLGGLAAGSPEDPPVITHDDGGDNGLGASQPFPSDNRGVLFSFFSTSRVLFGSCVGLCLAVWTSTVSLFHFEVSVNVDQCGPR